MPGFPISRNRAVWAVAAGKEVSVQYLLLYTIVPSKKVLGAGYLFCPRCRERNPGERFLEERFLYALGFLPLWAVGEAKHYYACHRCAQSFEETADHVFDFGDHAHPKLWDCLRCGELNPSDRFNCRRCGRRI